MTQPTIFDPTNVEWLASTYGAYIDTQELAQLLSYPNRKAVRRAFATGRLGIPLAPLQGRRGLFATAGDVSAYLIYLKNLNIQP